MAATHATNYVSLTSHLLRRSFSFLQCSHQSSPMSSSSSVPIQTEKIERNTLPDLQYSLRDRKWSIAIFWTLVLIDVMALPIVLYFTLFFATDLSHNAVFSISTGALGSVSLFEYALRFWRLWRKNSTCRVIGGRRAYVCDHFDRIDLLII